MLSFYAFGSILLRVKCSIILLVAVVLSVVLVASLYGCWALFVYSYTLLHYFKHRLSILFGNVLFSFRVFTIIKLFNNICVLWYLEKKQRKILTVTCICESCFTRVSSLLSELPKDPSFQNITEGRTDKRRSAPHKGKNNIWKSNFNHIFIYNRLIQWIYNTDDNICNYFQI